MTNKPDQLHWQTVYNKPPEEIPWEIAEPPTILTEVIEKGEIKPSLALDVGCGTGNYTLYLGKQGFQVIGVDYVESALLEADKKNTVAGLHNIFLSLDVRNLAATFKTQFSFILEYSLLHHIADEDLEAYIAQYSKLLQNGGRLLLVCYTPKHHKSNGQRVVVGKYGNAMYFRSADEIRRLFNNLNEVWYKQTTLGKDDEHPAHAFLFEKK